MIWDRPLLHWNGPLPEGWRPNLWWTSGPHRGDVPSGCGILAGLAAVGLSGWLSLDADWSGKDAFFANFTALQVGLATKSIGMLQGDNTGKRLVKVS